jgi:hypothetical protein
MSKRSRHWRMTRVEALAHAALILALMPCLFASSQTGAAVPSPTALMRRDVNRLVARARALNTVWPWQLAIPEVDRVARHGIAVAPLLVALLPDDPEEAILDSSGGLDLAAQQQVEIALCRIFGIREDCGYIYCNRVSDDVNLRIKQFWLTKIKEAQ